MDLNSSKDNLSDPAHNMSEYAFFNRSVIYSEDGVSILGRGSVVYMINTGYVPVTRLEDVSTGKYVDYEYLGKIILFGREFYVRSISSDSIYVCNGSIRNTDNLGFYGDYGGYKFKVDSMSYSGTVLSTVLLDVQKPDGTVVQRLITSLSNGVVDSLEMRVLNTSLSGSRTGVQLLVYDLGSQIILHEGASFSINGVLNDEWVASFMTVEQPLPAGLEILPYGGIDFGQKLLANVSLTFTGSRNISAGGNLSLPSGYKVIHDGQDIRIVNSSSCDLIGDFEPCWEVSLPEVVDHINKWGISEATLDQVIALINQWILE
jgi:hypothetical protein